MQQWFGDTNVPTIVSGCQPTMPSASLLIPAFACAGYVRSTDDGLIYVAQDATASVGPLNQGNGSYWLALHRDSTTTVGGWTRASGTAYLWTKRDERPAEPSQGLIFSKVTVAGGVITAIADQVRPGTGWVENRLIGTRLDNPKTPQVFFVNTAPPSAGPPPAVWHQIDVTTFGVPYDATSVDLGGILIITHGSDVEICNLTVAIRAPGDATVPGNYVLQTIEADNTAGQRDSAYVVAPVKNGIFELQWNRTPATGDYPLKCAFGINLALQRYSRAGAPPGATAGVVVPPQELTGVLNVQSYGAVGNGVTDDTAEIQAALDAVSATGRRTIWIPPGTYCLSADLRIRHSGTKLMGAGGNVSILRTCTNWTTPTITGALAAQVNLIHSSITNGPTGTTPITDITIDGVGFEGMAHANIASPKCISGLYAQRVTIINSTFIGSPYDCIVPGAGFVGAEWIVSNNHFFNTGQSVTTGHVGGAAVQCSVQGCVVSNNTFKDVATAVGSLVTGARTAIVGNAILFPTLTGIELGGIVADTGLSASAGGTDEVIVSGNTLAIQAIGGVVRRGLTVLEPARSLSLSGNTIRLFTAAGGEQLFGIALQGPYQGGCHVGGNTILMDAGAGSLGAGKKFVGIYGEAGPVNNQLHCTLASNTIELFNNTASPDHTGIFALAESGDTMRMVATDNVLRGFTSPQYAMRLSRTAGTMIYTASGNVSADAAPFEFNGVTYCTGECGATPVYSNSNTPVTFLEKGLRLFPQTLAALGTLPDGTLAVCSDCQVQSGSDNTCTGGGSGALLYRRGAVNRCFALQN